MKIKTNQELFDVDGKTPIKNGDKLLTLRDVCSNAVLSPASKDDEKKKFEKWEIFKILRDAGDEAELTAEQITTIKRGIGEIYPPLILGQAFEMLEGKL